ncbi:MAG: zinc ABC transporter substrate-binding protein [Desulfobacteraceae bacterium]|nr:zinc ABC transporter substrate-binding protein [Desulfobacteraceae bacterium]
MKIKILRIFVLFLFVFSAVQLQASDCFGEKIPVIASIFPVADMVKQVGGMYVDVTIVIPSGASPHTYEPKPSLLKKISDARIFFIIGAGLELWAGKFVRLSKNQIYTVKLSEGVSLIRLSEHIHDEFEHHRGEADISDTESGFANPHIWLDPEIAKLMVNKIIFALCKIDNKNMKYYERRGSAYLDKLNELHVLITSTVEKFKTRKYISFHPAWDYFARRYGLESVGVIEAAPGRHPTPRSIQNIISLIKQHNIRAVFAEPQLNPKVAEVIAREANVKVLLLDPMGGQDIKGRDTYFDLMKYNLNVLQEAML